MNGIRDFFMGKINTEKYRTPIPSRNYKEEFEEESSPVLLCIP